MEQPLELAVGQVDMVQGFKVSPEVVLQASPVPDIRSVGVLEIGELLDEGKFNLLFGHLLPLWLRSVGQAWPQAPVG